VRRHRPHCRPRRGVPPAVEYVRSGGREIGRGKARAREIEFRPDFLYNFRA
jgi:hypothetical protein